uniref:Uncharacterized protein n=1 Tax=Percolomonas cosmopolitus TaxID=63605 RepID=A0A7S1KUB7_9EUKA
MHKKIPPSLQKVTKKHQNSSKSLHKALFIDTTTTQKLRTANRRTCGTTGSMSSNQHAVSPLMPSLTIGIISLEHELSHVVDRFVQVFASESDADEPSGNCRQLSFPELGSHKIFLSRINISDKKDYLVWNELHAIDIFVMIYNKNDWNSFAKTTKFLRRLSLSGVKGVLVGATGIPAETSAQHDIQHSVVRSATHETNAKKDLELSEGALNVEQLTASQEHIGSSTDNATKSVCTIKSQHFEQSSPAHNLWSGASARMKKVERTSPRSQSEKRPVTEAQVQSMRNKFSSSILECVQMESANSSGSTQALVEVIVGIISQHQFALKESQFGLGSPLNSPFFAKEEADSSSSHLTAVEVGKRRNSSLLRILSPLLKKVPCISNG